MSDNWEVKPGTEDKGRWTEYINPRTGESSIKEHHLKTVWVSCPKGECYFELTNSAQRECTCSKCGAIKHFVLGVSNLKEGKIISMV